jgi:hypothetical protein
MLLLNNLGIILWSIFIGLNFLAFLYNIPELSLSDILYFVTDGKDVNLHGHVKVDKEAGKAIGQGLQTIGSQIGLGATMVGIATAVSKAVVKSGMPPLQKAGIIVGTSVIGGLAHSRISSMNRNTINSTSILNNETSSNVNKFLEDSHVSPLQDLLFNLEMMNYVCLSLIYILIIQLVFKLYFKDTINFNFFNLLSSDTKIKLEYYLNKIIKLNKQINIIWIWIGSVVIMFASSLDAYTLQNLCVNIDSYINIHNSLFSNNNDNSIYIDNKSILEILLNLKRINYISIISIISLMSLVMLKFNLNKNINNLYIWLILIILIFSLAFSAYTYNDLYTNIDSYVNTYLNIRNK